METNLRGQGEAIRLLTHHFATWQNRTSQTGPLIFLFWGPTKTGKTEAANLFARSYLIDRLVC